MKEEVIIMEGQRGNIKTMGVQVAKCGVQEATIVMGFEHVLAIDPCSPLHTCGFQRSGSMPLPGTRSTSPCGETSQQPITVSDKSLHTPSTQFRDGFHGGLGIRPSRTLRRSSPSLSRC